jgi:hypothetical protein
MTEITERNDLLRQCQHIAGVLSRPEEQDDNEDGTVFSAHDFLEDVLDIEYIVNGRADYLGARVLVAFGGPTIWVNTRTRIVEGSWWDGGARVGFTDNLGLDDALHEMWNCS